MPWYLPWSESIKKRACRYLLQRYLGQFLEEKLTLDQLTVDLYNGRGTVSEVSLDVQALNELGEQQNLPVEFVDGYISEISVSIPWASLLSESSFVEVSGLALTIQPKQRADIGTSMFESMWSSMTSSMQLAEECLKQGSTDEREAEPLEGLELFAQTIDSILSRVKVKFVDTVIRLEHVPKDSSTGVAIEIRIKNIDYLDEAGADPPADASPLPGETNLAFHIAAFTTKKFCLEGVTIYTDEFPSRARTFSRSVMSMSAGSTPDSKNSDGLFTSAPGSPSQSVTGAAAGGVGNNAGLTSQNLSLEPDPILCGKLAGRHELRIKLKQAEGVAGPKVDLELNLGSLAGFLSPRQLHILLELMHGLSQPDTVDTSNVAPRSRCAEKPMDPSDFQRVEHELQHHVHPLSNIHTKGLQDAQAWSTAPLDESDDEFWPMKGRGCGLSESVLSNATSMDTSLSSSISGATSNYSSKDGGSRLHSAGSPLHHQSLPDRLKPKSQKGSGIAPDADPTAEVSHFQVRLGSLALVLLHEDVLTLSVDLDGTSLARSSVQQMKDLAQSFFDKLGLFSISAMGGPSAFNDAQEVFLKALQLNHIRLLAAAVILEGRERTTIHTSTLTGQVTAASVEVLECLIEKKSPSQNQTTVEYVELLKFVHETEESNSQPPYLKNQQPDLRLNFLYTERLTNGPARRYIQPRTEISISLQPCWAEVDISIVDRITAVLNPQPMCCPSQNKVHSFPAQECKREAGVSLNEALDTASQNEGRVEVKVSGPSINLKLRFPTPDLRPIHDMDRPPWWKRCVRNDFLLLNLSDASFRTALDNKEPCSMFEIQCRDIHGLFQEGDSDQPISFLRAHAEEKIGQSLLCGTEGFDWPRLVVRCFQESLQGDFEDVPEPDESVSFTSVDLLKNAAHKEPSPFSSKRVVHESDTPHGKATCPTQEGEEIIIPGDRQEMAEFIRHASHNSCLQFDIHLPCATVQFPSKHIYELIYNRISTDLFLWEPAAPRPKPPSGIGGQDLWSPLASLSLYPAFTMCKSGIQYESDSESCDDTEDDPGVYYSVYEHRQRLKQRQQSTCGRNRQPSQSKVTVAISVGQGVFTIFTPVRDSTGNVIPGQQGELFVQLDEGSMFLVKGYRGSPKLGYVCVQLNHAAVFHNSIGPVPPEYPPLHPVGKPPGVHLIPTMYRSEPGVLAASTSPTVGLGSQESLDMVTVALRIQVEDNTHHIKTFRVATGIRGATLRHRMSAAGHSWFRQLTDFFDILDYPVAGYDPPGVITELHLHLWDCAVDYRPLHLPLKSILTVGSLSLSSNIAAQTKTSTLRFLAEDACLLLAEQQVGSASGPIDVCRDYVCVLDLGLFELSLRLCEKTNGVGPRVDLRASINLLNIRTCPDSARALTDLLAYFAGDGDLISQSQSQQSSSSSNRQWGSESVASSGASSSGTVREGPPISPARSHSCTDTLVQLDGGDLSAQPALSASQVQHVHFLMEEAMLDTNGQSVQNITASPRTHKNSEGVEVFFFPDESQKTKKPSIGSVDSLDSGADHTMSSENPEMNEGPPEVEDEEVEEEEEDWDEEFCILEEVTGTGIPPRSGLPEIRALTPEPIHVMENHFSVPHGKTDLLKPPKHYPIPILRYTLREMSVVWFMYGGHDFGPAKKSAQSSSVKKRVQIEDGRKSADSMGSPQSSLTPCSSPTEMGVGVVSFSKTSPSEVRFGVGTPPLNSPKIQRIPQKIPWQARGGPGRKHDTLMELQLNKVRFQYDVYPENTREASRQVLLINEMEVRDRLASSEINKFLYQYSSETRPKQSHANMVVLKALHLRPDPKLTAQECCLKVSLLPLRLNIDQDSLLFLYSFFSEISGGQDDDDEGAQSPTPRHNTPTHQHSHQPPVMTVNIGEEQHITVFPEQSALLIQLEETDALAEVKDRPAQRAQGSTSSSPSGQEGCDDQPPSPPIYFRSFVFTPEVPIRLDYQGKHVDMTHGPLAGLLMGLGQLSCSELKLKRLSHRHGLLGFDKLMAFVLSEWLQDIKKNQLPSLLGGVGPMHSLVQLFQGIRDLFWLPIEQYQKDGRIVRGLQRGANSFTTSTAMAVLELTSHLVQAIQCTAETAYDMLSPGPSVKHRAVGTRGRGHRRKRYNQPIDIREGMANAYTLVKDGIGETAQTIVRVASEEHEQKGVSGAVGGVLRQIPPSVVKPIILVSEATHNVLGGMRSQLVPDARREAVEKWRSDF